jgi:hypothetical protein
MTWYKLNNGVRLTHKAQRLISGDICPLCEKNKVADIKLKVGYERDFNSFSTNLFRLVNRFFSNEVFGYVPICEHCKDEYLAFRLSDPSKTLLSHKARMHRGLSNPYSRENIIFSQTSGKETS